MTEANSFHTQWIDLLQECLWQSCQCLANLRLARIYLQDPRTCTFLTPTQLVVFKSFLDRLWESYYAQPAWSQDILTYTSWVTQGDEAGLKQTRHSLLDWQQQLVALDTLLSDLAIRLFHPPSTSAAPLPVPTTSQSRSRTDIPRGALTVIAFLEILTGQTHVFAPPRWIILDQSNVCNLKCKMCTAHAEGIKHVPCYFSSLEQIQEPTHLADRISLGGTGEPLMHPDLNRLVAFKNPTTFVTLNTNASLLHLNLDQLAAVNQIEISFDGASAETFETLRLGSRFETICENVKLLRKHFPNKIITLNAVVSRANVDELHAIAGKAVELGIRYVVFNPIHTCDALQFLKLQRSDFPCFQEQLNRIQKDFSLFVTASSNLLPENFSEDQPDDSRNKNQVLEKLKTLRKSPPLVKTWEELEHATTSFAKFTWFPKGMQQASVLPFENSPSPVYCASAVALVQTKLLTELANQRRIQLPYCLAPWLITYINSNSTVRPCCFYNVNLGETLADKPWSQVWNSPSYRFLRQALLTRKNLPHPCRQCTASMRYWSKPGLLEYAKSLGLNYLGDEDILETTAAVRLPFAKP